MLELCNDYRENVRRMDERMRVNENFDLIKKVLYLGEQQITLYYIDGFVDGGSMNKLMMFFLSQKGLGNPSEPGGEAAARYFVEHSLPYVEGEYTSDTVLMEQMLLRDSAIIETVERKG